MGTLILPVKQFDQDQLHVKVYESRNAMGIAAAYDIRTAIHERLQHQDCVRIIFAAAPSQNDVLASLVEDETIEWSKVIAFHMDEYIGLPVAAPQSFGQFLKNSLFSKVPFKEVHYINSSNGSKEECVRYASLITLAPIDFVCLGIGENGHLAFNDPPVADFNDSEIIKLVELDDICRQQQVNDGCFSSIEEVPIHAFTLTIPTLLSASQLFCIVPSATKANAVKRTLGEGISTACPSTILRQHGNCTLYLEPASYGEAK